MCKNSIKTKKTASSSLLVGRDGFEPSKTKVDGFTVRCIWPLCNLPKWSWWSELNQQPSDYKSDALPLSHTSMCKFLTMLEIWCRGAESNHRHRDFQSLALPTELPRHIPLFLKRQNFGDPEGARTLDLQRDRLAL